MCATLDKINRDWRRNDACVKGTQKYTRLLWGEEICSILKRASQFCGQQKSLRGVDVSLLPNLEQFGVCMLFSFIFLALGTQTRLSMRDRQLIDAKSSITTMLRICNVENSIIKLFGGDSCLQFFLFFYLYSRRLHISRTKSASSDDLVARQDRKVAPWRFDLEGRRAQRFRAWSVWSTHLRWANRTWRFLCLNGAVHGVLMLAEGRESSVD